MMSVAPPDRTQAGRMARWRHVDGKHKTGPAYTGCLDVTA